MHGALVALLDCAHYCLLCCSCFSCGEPENEQLSTSITSVGEVGDLVSSPQQAISNQVHVEVLVAIRY